MYGRLGKKPPCPWICCICSVWSLRCVCGLEHGYFLGKGVRNNKKNGGNWCDGASSYELRFSSLTEPLAEGTMCLAPNYLSKEHLARVLVSSLGSKEWRRGWEKIYLGLLSAILQCHIYSQPPYLMQPESNEHAIIEQDGCGDPPRRPWWSCVRTALIPPEEWAGADALWSEESDSTQLCLRLQTADLSHSPGKFSRVRSPETVPNKYPGMRHCRPLTAVWTFGWRSSWRLSEIRHTWPKFHLPLYLLTSGYLQCNLFAAAQLLANCVVASAVLGLGTCWEGPC